jgi:U3 small nucleolar RNA-associated protein 11
MLSAGKGSQGKHGRGEETNRLSHDAVKLLKSQDAGYLRTVAGRGRRELERLEQVVGLEGVLGTGEKHTGNKIQPV